MKQQQGASLVTLLVGLTLFLLLARVAVAVVPMYLDDGIVSTMVSNFKDNERVNAKTSKRELKAMIEQGLRSSNVSADISKLNITKQKGRLILDWPYERRENIIGNLDIVLRFEHQAIFQ